MLDITVTLRTGRGSKVVGTIHIINDGSGTIDLANYDVYLIAEGKQERRATVYSHDRSKGWGRLLLLALRALEEKP